VWQAPVNAAKEQPTATANASTPKTAANIVVLAMPFVPPQGLVQMANAASSVPPTKRIVTASASTPKATPCTAALAITPVRRAYLVTKAPVLAPAAQRSVAASASTPKAAVNIVALVEMPVHQEQAASMVIANNPPAPSVQRAQGVRISPPPLSIAARVSFLVHKAQTLAPTGVVAALRDKKPAKPSIHRALIPPNARISIQTTNIAGDAIALVTPPAVMLAKADCAFVAEPNSFVLVLPMMSALV
jgi:hypothetical protein